MIRELVSPPALVDKRPAHGGPLTWVLKSLARRYFTRTYIHPYKLGGRQIHRDLRQGRATRQTFLR